MGVNWLTNPLKKRVMRELKSILRSHPKYALDAENVQNKYSFNERPQRGMVVKGASGDRVRLSADNYIGRLSSFVMLTRVGNSPGTSLEWVKENLHLMEKYSSRRDVFPSPPGAYILEVTSLPDEPRNLPGSFEVDPILSVNDEPLVIFSSDEPGESQLSREGIEPGTVRLWLDRKRPLLDGVDYGVDYKSGTVTFLRPTPPGSTVFADYRYRTGIQGPFPFYYEETDMSSIPGAILAFGDRAQKCDKLAIVVTDDRTDVAEVFGGKFEVSLELVAFSRDAEDREKMSDYVILSMLERQNALGYEGLELLDISPGGENEEIYNETTDEYYYDSNISLSMRVDWSVFVPLPVEVWRAEVTSKAAESRTGYLDGSFLADLLRIGDPTSMAGVAAVIGKDIGYDRVR